MLRVPLLVAFALAVAFGGGILASLRAIEAADPFDVLMVGPWQANPHTYTDAANPYEKARRARTAGFALGRAEGLLFRASTDSVGAALAGTCAYRISGDTPASRFFILRLLDAGGKTLTAPDEAFPAALHSYNLLRREDGTFTLTLDGHTRAGNWLRLDHSGPVQIELVLFDSPAVGSFGLVDLAMPEIERLDCRDA